MPNTEQAKKRLRQTEKKRAANKAAASRMKTEMKKVITAIEEGDPAAAEQILPEAFKRIDKAAKRRVIHPNNAARKKSLLARKLKSVQKSS
jgi:small subunit ribosomal protein S20